MENQQQQQQMEIRRRDGDGAASPLIFRIAKSFSGFITALMGILQVKYQGKDESIFNTQPVNMWVFVFSTFIYFSTAEHAVAVAVISGSLSSVSLVSVLLPRFLGRLIFIPWAFVSILVAFHVHADLIRYACERLQQMVLDGISAIWTWFTRSRSSEQQRLPVSNPFFVSNFQQDILTENM